MTPNPNDVIPKEIKKKILEDIKNITENPVMPTLEKRVVLLEKRVDEMQDVLRKIYEVVKE